MPEALDLKIQVALLEKEVDNITREIAALESKVDDVKNSVTEIEKQQVRGEEILKTLVLSVSELKDSFTAFKSLLGQRSWQIWLAISTSIIGAIVAWIVSLTK